MALNRVSTLARAIWTIVRPSAPLAVLTPPPAVRAATSVAVRPPAGHIRSTVGVATGCVLARDSGTLMGR